MAGKERLTCRHRDLAKCIRLAAGAASRILVRNGKLYVAQPALRVVSAPAPAITSAIRSVVPGCNHDLIILRSICRVGGSIAIAIRGIAAITAITAIAAIAAIAVTVASASAAAAGAGR